MANQRRSQSGNNTQPQEEHKIPVNEETLSKILEVEKSKIELRMSERAFREKHVDNQAALAREQLRAQADYLKRKPRQDRYFMITVGSIVAVILLIVLSFLLILIFWHETEFAKYLLVTVSHIIVGVLSFVAGKGRKQSLPPSMDDNIEDAQITN